MVPRYQEPRNHYTLPASQLPVAPTPQRGSKDAVRRGTQRPASVPSTQSAPLRGCWCCMCLSLLYQHTSSTVSRKHASHLKDGRLISLTKEPVHTSYPFHQFIFTSRRTWEKLLGQNGSRRMLKTPDWRTSLVVQRVKTTFQCRGCGFNPRSGSSDPHASQWETKTKNRSSVVTNSIKTLMLHIKKKKS